MYILRFEVDEKRKILMLWLTQAEDADEAFKKSLLAEIEEGKMDEYRLIVFSSGKRELFSMTEGLLLHNYRLPPAKAETAV